MREESIILPVFGIVIRLNHGEEYTTGSIEASELFDDEPDEIHTAALEGITSMILAAACAGVDVGNPAFLEAIETAVDAVTNKYT